MPIIGCVLECDAPIRGVIGIARWTSSNQHAVIASVSQHVDDAFSMGQASRSL
jgi:hypothetical protein